MSRPSEYATLHQSRRDVEDTRSGLLWGADLRNLALLWRSALEHGLVGEKGSDTAVELPTVFIRTFMYQFKRTANEQEVEFLFRKLKIREHALGLLCIR